MFSRHAEYQLVFEKLYEFLKKDNPEKNPIVITGDILHNKVDLTPECCLVTYEFLASLGQIAPTFLIAGNHDALLNNRHRMDSLQSILYDRNPPNVYYLAKTQVYPFQNVVFVVNSLLDEDDWLIPGSVRNDHPDKIIVALYHGQVGNWVNGKGFKSETYDKECKAFDGAGLVLLGDIHKHQYMDKKKTMGYAGSLISQNFSETDDDHGVLIWDLVHQTSTLHKIWNDYAYKECRVISDMEVEIEGKVTNIKQIILPTHGSLRLLLGNDVQINREAQLKLKEKYPALRIHSIYPITQKNNITADNFSPVLDDAFFIQEYVEKKWKGNPHCKKVVEELQNYFSKYHISTTTWSDWEILSLEFEHMFGYGPKNLISFQSFQPCTVIGIFGRNSCGKSTLIDILAFMLYGKITRGSGNSTPKELIHANEKKSHGEIKIKIGSSIYQISKSFTRMKNDKIQIKERLFEIQDGIKRELTDEQRRRTDKLITEKIGTLENFLFTNVMLQQREKSFREMTQANKKDFLYQLFHLDWFEKLRKEKEEELRSIKAQFKILQQKLSGKSKEVYETEKAQLMTLCQSTESQITEEEKGIQEMEVQIEQIRKGVIPISSCCDSEDLKKLVLKIQNSEKELDKLSKEVFGGESALKNLETLYEEKSKLEDSSILHLLNHTKNSLFIQWTQQSTLVEWKQEYQRRMDLFSTLEEVKQKWFQKKKEYEDNLVQLRNERPMVEGICMEEEEWKIVQENFNLGLKKQNEVGERILKFQLLLNEDEAWDHNQLEKALQTLDKLWNEYQMKESLYQMNIQKNKEDQQIQYNKDCRQCQENPYFYKQKEVQQHLQQEGKILCEKKENLGKKIKAFQQLMKEEGEEGDWEIVKNKYKNRIREVNKARQGLEKLYKESLEFQNLEKVFKNQELLHQQKQVDGRIKYWMKLEKGDEDRKKYEAVLSSLEEMPILNEIEKSWAMNNVPVQLEELNQEIQRLERLEKKLALQKEKWQCGKIEMDKMKIQEAEWKKDLEAFEKNKPLEKELMNLKLLVQKKKEGVKSLWEKKKDYEIQYARLEFQSQESENSYQELERFTQEQQWLEILIGTMDRDGLPLYLLSKKLPEIEQYINNIIQPFMNRPLLFHFHEKELVLGAKTGGENQISGFYGGMEAFIVDVALKVTFARFGKLSRSNFFIIDEGVSVLDQERVANIKNLFDFILGFTNHVFIMSHLPLVKDFVAHRIEITKEEESQKSHLQVY